MKNFNFIILSLLLISPLDVFATDDSVSNNISSLLESIISPITSFFSFILLGSEYKIFNQIYQLTIFNFPLIVVWLISASLFFTIKLKFVNVRLFKHGIDVVRGKYDDISDKSGKISPMQALCTAVSATVGLGNIAGVAIAISLGGPGAVFWMMIAAFFGMTTKFIEVTLGQKYRKIKDGHLLAGPFYYLEHGLKDHNYQKLGKILAKFAAISCIAEQ